MSNTKSIEAGAISRVGASEAGRVASAAKLLVQSGLFWESLKRELDLPPTEIDGLTVEDFFANAHEAPAHEEIATRIALWAGAGRFHQELSQEEASLVEDGLRALLKPISEGA